MGAWEFNISLNKVARFCFKKKKAVSDKSQSLHKACLWTKPKDNVEQKVKLNGSMAQTGSSSRRSTQSAFSELWPNRNQDGSDRNRKKMQTQPWGPKNQARTTLFDVLERPNSLVCPQQPTTMTMASHSQPCTLVSLSLKSGGQIKQASYSPVLHCNTGNQIPKLYSPLSAVELAEGYPYEKDRAS